MFRKRFLLSWTLVDSWFNDFWIYRIKILPTCHWMTFRKIKWLICICSCFPFSWKILNPWLSHLNYVANIFELVARLCRKGELNVSGWQEKQYYCKFWSRYFLNLTSLESPNPSCLLKDQTLYSTLYGKSHSYHAKLCFKYRWHRWKPIYCTISGWNRCSYWATQLCQGIHKSLVISD